jgi:hypothetical protein
MPGPPNGRRETDQHQTLQEEEEAEEVAMGRIEAEHDQLERTQQLEQAILENDILDEATKAAAEEDSTDTSIEERMSLLENASTPPSPELVSSDLDQNNKKKTWINEAVAVEVNTVTVEVKSVMIDERPAATEAMISAAKTATTASMGVMPPQGMKARSKKAANNTSVVYLQSSSAIHRFINLVTRNYFSPVRNTPTRPAGTKIVPDENVVNVPRLQLPHELHDFPRRDYRRTKQIGNIMAMRTDVESERTPATTYTCKYHPITRGAPCKKTKLVTDSLKRRVMRDGFETHALLPPVCCCIGSSMCFPIRASTMEVSIEMSPGPHIYIY